MTFVNNVAGFNLLDDFCIVIVQRASAFVTFFNRCVKTSLFNMPLCYFQVLINIHFILLIVKFEYPSGTNAVKDTRSLIRFNKESEIFIETGGIRNRKEAEL